MKIELDQLFLDAIPILKTLEKNGFQAFFVGGSVRDALLKRPIHDIDITTDATPRQMKDIFETADNYSGEKHGTDLVFFSGKNYEITTFRIDGKYKDDRHPDHVTFTKSLREDLARRDFTINAIAMDSEGRLFDYFGGLDDLKKGVIRSVGMAKKRFSEDALRILRAFRFASQLDFKISPNTLTAATELSNHLRIIATERIFTEFSKLLTGSSADTTLKKMYDLSITKNLPGNDLISDPRKLFYSYRVPKEAEENICWIRFVYLTQLSGNELMLYLKNWKMSNELIKTITKSLALINNPKPDPLDLYNCGQYFYFAIKAWHRSDERELIEKFENLPIHSNDQLKINGNDLIRAGLIPGPKIGKILNELKQKVIYGRVENSRESLIKEFLNDNRNLGSVKK